MKKTNAFKLASCRNLSVLLLLMLVLLPAMVTAEVTTGIEDESGLRSWTWRQGGVSVKLVQRLPDQTRAFFIGRGFPRDAADLVGRACFFQTIFRNDDKLPVAYDLSQWVVYYGDDAFPMRLRADWDSIWQTGKISPSARIALRWSLLPTHQRFEPGDYNWGMTSYGVQPGERFDLDITMTVGGKSVTDKIEAIQCAADAP